MLYHKHVPLAFWAKAVNTAAYILNRVASRTLHGLTPYEKWTGSKPNVSHLCVFGNLAYSHIPKEIRQKLDSKTRECMFVGYANNSKAYRLWCPAQQRIIISRDVIFDEDSPLTFSPDSTSETISYRNLFPLLDSASPALGSISTSSDINFRHGNHTCGSTSATPHIHSTPCLGCNQSSQSVPLPVPNNHPSPSVGVFNSHENLFELDKSNSRSIQHLDVIDNGSTSSISASDSHVPSNNTPCLSASSSDSLNNIIHTHALSDLYRNTSPIPFQGYSSSMNSQVNHDFSPSGTSSATVAVSSHKTLPKPSNNFIVLPDEPKTIAQMLKSEHRHQWELAMAEEINSLQQNQTWTIETLPHGRTAVDNKWVFKIKTKSDGTVDHFKARLVAKGYSQTVGVDYGETYAPTAKMDSIRTLLALAAAEDSEMIQFDVKTAFLYGELSEELYMNLPTGYTIPNSAGKVCRLRKSLYGLK